MLKIYSQLSGGALNAQKEELSNSKLALFGYGCIGKISYKRELSGEENMLSRFATLSRETSAILLAGAITDNYGVIKKSIIVCERGKLIGICDATLIQSESTFSVGGAFRVYHLNGLKLGVLVDDDLLNPEGVKAMTLCDADVIVCITSSPEKPEYNFLVRAYAYLYGVPFYLLTQNSVMASDIHGEITGKSTKNTSTIIVPTKKQYTLLKQKRRGARE